MMSKTQGNNFELTAILLENMNYCSGSGVDRNSSWRWGAEVHHIRGIGRLGGEASNTEAEQIFTFVFPSGEGKLVDRGVGVGWCKTWGKPPLMLCLCT